MRLKSLTLSGFKSFAKRTTIHFPPGISAVVGPNGCGKSNIIDAIRWVLGEQSPRLLRARSMDDIIFRGSHRKTPQAAYVKLVMENQGDLAPPELKEIPEIEIERTLFPTGETKYRLNRKNCRLKEIRYLFMDTGAGTRAYSIIDQGQVNEFVEMTPEERRFMVEEVAGISRYKARRSEAKRQMKETRQNLERLEDVIHEVARQMRSLKRQASKARRYMEIKNRREELEKGLMVIEWQENSHKLSRLSKEIQDLERDMATEETRANTVGVEKKKIEILLSRATEQLQTSKQELKRLRQKQDSLQDRQIQLKNSRVRTESRLEAELKGREEFSERLDSARRALHEVGEDIVRLQQEIQHHTELKQKDRESLVAMEREEQQLRKGLDAARDRLMDQLSLKARLDSEQERAETRIQQLEDRIDRHQEKQQAIGKEIDRVREKLKVITEQQKEVLHQEEEEQDRLKTLQEKRSSIEYEIKKIDQRDGQISKKMQALQIRLSTLEALDRSGAGFGQGERAILESPGGKGLRPLASLIEVKKGWEAIVETALSAMARALLVDSLQEAEGLCKVVSRRKKGSAALFIKALAEKRQEKPVDEKGLEQDQVKRSATTVGKESAGIRLSSVVRAKESSAASAVEFLRRVAFAPTLREAASLLMEEETVNPHRDERTKTGKELAPPLLEYAVTRDLQILSRNGLLIVHAPGSLDEMLIYRRTETARLREEKKILEREQDSISSAKARLRQRLKAVVAAISQAENHLQTLNKEKKVMEKEYGSLSIEKEKLQNRMDLLEFERDEAVEEINIARKELEEILDKVQTVAKREQKARQELARLEEENSIRSEALSQAREMAKKTEVLLSALQTELKEKKARRESLSDELKRLSSQAEQAKESVCKLKETLAEIDRKAKALEGKRSEISRTAHNAKGHVRAAESKVLDLEEQMRQAESAIKEIRHNISLKSQRISTLKEQLKEASVAMERLAQNGMARFKVHPETISTQSILMDISPEEAMKEVARLREKMEKMGSINLAAIQDFQELSKRHEYLMTQKSDLLGSLEDIDRAIQKIDKECTEKFTSAVKEINGSLKQIFPLLFDGGDATLKITPGEGIWDSGIEYRIQLPGKKIRHLGLLSGGEKALCALALIFAIFFIKPSPFCLLDEVDAPLDQANTDRFNSLVRRISARSQVLLVTHNQKVMEIADTLYGVTMEGKSGISKLVTVDLVEQSPQARNRQVDNEEEEASNA